MKASRTTKLVLPVVVGIAALTGQGTSGAGAQDSLTAFVSSSGNNANDCGTPSTPCASFTVAHSKMADGGSIMCLNAGYYGFLNITKSITVDCLAGGGAGNSDSISINAPGKTVTLRNLAVNGYGISISAPITINAAGSVHLENVIVTGAAAGSTGIRFQPPAPGAQLVVTDSTITSNGSGPNGGGIVVSPQAGGTAQVALNRVVVTKNVFGIAVDGTGSTGGINITITDSVISGNAQDGIIANTPGGGAPIGVLVTNTKSVNNNIGIRSIGPNVTVRVESSKITGNGTGLSFSSGGALHRPETTWCRRMPQTGHSREASGCNKAQGVGLHIIDLGGDVCGNGISKLVFTILAAVAENERDRIRCETGAALIGKFRSAR